jgi:hypothetical protein
LTFQRLCTARHTVCKKIVSRTTYTLYTDWKLMKHIIERFILDLAIVFDSLVPLTPPTWLTAVKQDSLSFFQRNKDPRAYIEKCLRFNENPENCLNFSGWVLFFQFLSQSARIGSNVSKKGVFDILIQSFFYENTRNVIFGI